MQLYDYVANFAKKCTTNLQRYDNFVVDKANDGEQ